MQNGIASLLKQASKLPAIPGLNFLYPARDQLAHQGLLERYFDCQKLAQQGAKTVGNLIQEGWTEIQAANLLETWLNDHGVHGYFHHAYAWFGERTRFCGINRRDYNGYRPSKRCILPGEVFILDVAPIYRHTMCDIGYSSVLGENEEFEQANRFLKTLRDEIPRMFCAGISGAQICESLESTIKGNGYDCIHNLYPFSVLGHRVYHDLKNHDGGVGLFHFGWQSFSSLLSRGLFSQLLNKDYHGRLLGLWAIEPHIGTPSFGAKFEEILVVSESKAVWLRDHFAPAALEGETYDVVS